MIDDVDDIAAYYDESAAGEHERLQRHQLEHDLTWRYLDKYLPLRGSVLEIGAGTGRYTVDLARRGLAITAVDFSREMIAANRRNVSAAGLDNRVRFVRADARDLHELGEAQFEAVLIMGPLYHLIEREDRERALREAADRLQAGGVFFSAFISRYGNMGYLMRDRPEWIEDQVHVRSLLKNGRRPSGYPRGGFRGYLCDPAEIAPLHEAAGLKTVVVAGVEPAISADDESYNRLSGKRRRLWLDLLYEISAEPSIIGASRHLLYVGRKR